MRLFTRWKLLLLGVLCVALARAQKDDILEDEEDFDTGAVEDDVTEDEDATEEQIAVERVSDSNILLKYSVLSPCYLVT